MVATERDVLQLEEVAALVALRTKRVLSMKQQQTQGSRVTKTCPKHRLYSDVQFVVQPRGGIRPLLLPEADQRQRLTLSQA